MQMEMDTRCCRRGKDNAPVSFSGYTSVLSAHSNCQMLMRSNNMRYVVFVLHHLISFFHIAILESTKHAKLAHLTCVAFARSLFRSCLSCPLRLCNGSPASLQGQVISQLGWSGQESTASALDAIVRCAGTSFRHSIASRLRHVIEPAGARNMPCQLTPLLSNFEA